MSEKILFGSLDTLELVLFLSPKKYITSSIIRKKFPKIFSETIRHKLKKLGQQGFVEKRTKKGEYAGDDRTEFKLTDTGTKLRLKLVERTIEVMYDVINRIVKKKTVVTEIKEDKSRHIEDFIYAFSEECEAMLDNEKLKEQLGVLKKLLTKLL